VLQSVIRPDDGVLPAQAGGTRASAEDCTTPRTGAISAHDVRTDPELRPQAWIRIVTLTAVGATLTFNFGRTGSPRTADCRQRACPRHTRSHLVSGHSRSASTFRAFTNMSPTGAPIHDPNSTRSLRAQADQPLLAIQGQMCGYQPPAVPVLDRDNLSECRDARPLHLYRTA
jgi:hypothetical protein